MKKDDSLARRFPVPQAEETQVAPSRLDPLSREAKRRQAKITQANPEAIYVKVRPNIETITDDAYFVLAMTMEKLAQKVADEGETLDPTDVNAFVKMGDILVKMRREDRMSLGGFEDELEKMSLEEQAELARQLAEDLGDGNEET